MINTYDEYDNEIGIDEENSDDFFDYDDDFTEDTVSTEDTEDNSTNIYNDYTNPTTHMKSKKPVTNLNVSLSNCMASQIISSISIS